MTNTTTVPTEPHEMVEHFLAEAISNSPQPLQDLGKFLSEVLDEDHWKTADRLLLALAAAPVPSPPGKEVREAGIMAIHEALGGNGWAYTNYGGDELRSQRDELGAAFDAVLALLTPAGEGWRPISEAKKDNRPILVLIHPDLYPRIKPMREDLARWNGKQVVVRHIGLAHDGFDTGWTVDAPVGHGGFPDEWFAGFQPLPSPPVQPEGGR